MYLYFLNTYIHYNYITAVIDHTNKITFELSIYFISIVALKDYTIKYYVYIYVKVE